MFFAVHMPSHQATTVSEMVQFRFQNTQCYECGICTLKLTFLLLQEHNDWIIENKDLILPSHYSSIHANFVFVLHYIMQQCLVLKIDVEISVLCFIKNKLASKIWFVARIEFLKISEVSVNIFLPLYTMYLCKTKLSALIL